MTAAQRPNPFRIHGVVTQTYFTDRAKELKRIQDTLAEPGAKLVIYGPRRMGKTSAIAQAILRHQKKGGKAFMADFSTASTPVDMANRILEAAVGALGKDWRDMVTTLVQQIAISVTLKPDPTTGAIIPVLDLTLRSAPLEDQQQSLVAALNAINRLARLKKTTIGVALDEFQEISNFGGESAEWALRGAVQHHENVSYVLAGSASHLIQTMLGKGRALFALTDQMEFGAIDPEHLAKWIDSRFAAAGVRSAGVGARTVQVAGKRTRDIVQVARQTFANTVAVGQAVAKDVDAALDDVVAEQETPLRALWSSLTAHQQNVLRAVTASDEGLTTSRTITRFALPSSGTATNTAAALVNAGVLERSNSTAGYSFDNPFFRRWVEQNTLADLGMVAPIAPSATSSTLIPAGSVAERASRAATYGAKRTGRPKAP